MQEKIDFSSQIDAFEDFFELKGMKVFHKKIKIDQRLESHNLVQNNIFISSFIPNIMLCPHLLVDSDPQIGNYYPTATVDFSVYEKRL